MSDPCPQHPGEPQSNAVRSSTLETEPRSLRTYTPTLAVLQSSAGVFHTTADGRRLYDFTSGVLVANLGHNPRVWFRRFHEFMGWPDLGQENQGQAFFQAAPLTTYNAVTPNEEAASKKLATFLRQCPGGRRMEQVLWAASGSEAIQKALWAALARDPSRNRILATRYGFHGKKGLALATTGCETDPERDPRVRFISFPMEECRDVSLRDQPFNPLPYEKELENLRREYGRNLTALITEPYLGGGGSYHPPKEYLQLLQNFCRANDMIFILDEVQSCFGRTGNHFAFETYGLEPDVVVLGKGLANGVPGAAAVGPKALFGSLAYGDASDTYSGNPLVCAAVLATIHMHETGEPLANARQVSPIIEAGLVRLKEFPFVKYVRGEKNGMVWGVEFTDAESANAAVLACYRGDGGDGIHLLGPLAKKVIRIGPPLVITAEQAHAAMDLMFRLFRKVTV